MRPCWDIMIFFLPKESLIYCFFIYWTLQRKLLQKRETWAMSGEFRPVIFALISRKIPSILYIDDPVGPLPSQCPSIQGVEVSEVSPPQINIAAAWNFVSFKKLCFRIYSEEEEAGKTSLFLKVILKRIRIHKIFRRRQIVVNFFGKCKELIRGLN